MGDHGAEISASPIIEPECFAVKETLERELVTDALHEENKDNEPEIQDKHDSHTSVVSEKTLSQLSTGFLSHHVEDLKKMAFNLNELSRNQGIVIETLQQENTRFSETLKMYNLDDVSLKAKLYTMKLQQIKKEMAALHERSVKLRKRALRLQQQKQKEALHKELQRDQEIERDKQLAPKLASNS